MSTPSGEILTHQEWSQSNPLVGRKGLPILRWTLSLSQVFVLNLHNICFSIWSTEKNWYIERAPQRELDENGFRRGNDAKEKKERHVIPDSLLSACWPWTPAWLNCLVVLWFPWCFFAFCNKTNLVVLFSLSWEECVGPRDERQQRLTRRQKAWNNHFFWGNIWAFTTESKTVTQYVSDMTQHYAALLPQHRKTSDEEDNIFKIQ